METHPSFTSEETEVSTTSLRCPLPPPNPSLLADLTPTAGSALPGTVSSHGNCPCSPLERQFFLSCLVISKALKELSPWGRGNLSRCCRESAEPPSEQIPGSLPVCPKPFLTKLLASKVWASCFEMGHRRLPCADRTMTSGCSVETTGACLGKSRDDSSFLCNSVSRGTAPKPRPSEHRGPTNQLCSQRALYKLTHLQSMGRVQGIQSCY